MIFEPRATTTLQPDHTDAQQLATGETESSINAGIGLTNHFSKKSEWAIATKKDCPIIPGFSVSTKQYKARLPTMGLPPSLGSIDWANTGSTVERRLPERLITLDQSRVNGICWLTRQDIRDVGHDRWHGIWVTWQHLIGVFHAPPRSGAGGNRFSPELSVYKISEASKKETWCCTKCSQISHMKGVIQIQFVLLNKIG